MNTLRRVGLVVISCIILLLALLCPVSAAMVLEDDFILEESFNSGLMMTPNGTLASTSLTEPNYPSFNPNDIPWADAPQYVKEILSANLNDFNTPNFPFDTTRHLVPFVCVRVNGSNAMVYAGYNISVVWTSNNSRVNIGRVFPFNSEELLKIQTSTLYRATYNLSDMSLTTPWYNASSDAVAWDTLNDFNHVYLYTTTGLTTATGKYDLYFYGSSNVFNDASRNISSKGFYNGDAQDPPVASVTLNYPLGFSNDSSFFSHQSDYVNTYCKYFVPSIYPEINSGVVGDHSAAEDKLINSYNPDGLGSDLKVDIDAKSWGVIFNIFNLFITSNTFLYFLISTLLTFGIIALILGR